MTQAERVRTQSDSIARKMVQLARQGNPNAALIVDQLSRRGVTINPDAAPAPVPK